jgi:hypothetical protein
MGVSSSNTSAASARGGDDKIKPQGQTRGHFGNNPDVQTNISKEMPNQRIKPS